MLDLAEKWFAPLADRTVTPQPIPPGTAAGGAPPGDGRTRRARHDPVAGIPHGRPHLAGFLYRRPGLRPPVGRRLVASLQTPGAGTAPAGLGQRLHFGRRRPGVVRLYGATAAGYHSRTGRSGFPCRNRGIAECPGIGLRGREGQKTSSRPTRSSAS